MPSQLYRGEVVWDDSNYKSLIGDGNQVIAGGEGRLLSAIPRPIDAVTTGYAISFAQSGIKKIPRHEWSARIKELEEKKARCSDYCDFKAYDQNGLPYCWCFGPTQAAANFRRKQGHPFKQLSAASVGCIASGFRSRGGWEGEALEVLRSRGATTVDKWPENSLNRQYDNDANRQDAENYKCTKWVDLGDFDEFFTMLLLGFPCPVAYNWWRHVVYLADPVEIEANSFGPRLRNSWSDGWGAKNELGFGGFAVGREGRYTPSSGFALMQMTAYSVSI